MENGGDCTAMNVDMEKDISEVDPEIRELIRREKHRQREGLEMIASENFTSRAVLQAMGSCFHNKYSEGQVGARYYGGNEIVDEMETLCKERALKAYRLDPKEWGVNVQPYSGSPANFAVYTGLLQPHDRMMGLNLPDGGHLSHGFETLTKKVSATSIFFESMPYTVDPESGLIDYDKMEENALLFKPKIIIAGVSCYSRCLDYARFKKIAESVGAYLLSDMAHVSGLVAAGVIPSPFDHSDIVTTTTHKTLRGARAGMIFFRKGVRRVKPNGENEMYDMERKINEAVFPGLQGGPHNHAIAAVAVALRQALQPSFVAYQKQVIINAQTLCAELIKYGMKVVTGGTDIHLCLVDFRPQNIDGARVERILELVCIAANKNTCPGDKSALRPSGIRFGTPALTSRNMKEEDIKQVAEFIKEAVEVAVEAKAKCPGKLLKEFKAFVDENEEMKGKVNAIKEKVNKFALRFSIPGHDDM